MSEQADDGPIYPIPAAIAVLRGPPLTTHQREIAKQFIEAKRDRSKRAVLNFAATKAGRKKYASAFPVAIKFAECEAELARPLFRVRKRQILRDMKKLGYALTPGKTQAHMKRWELVSPICLAYFRKHGAPPNIQHLVTLIQKRLSGPKLTDRAVRKFLADRFGLRATPGPKPVKNPAKTMV